jgi:hypothetical protein
MALPKVAALRDWLVQQAREFGVPPLETVATPA